MPLRPREMRDRNRALVLDAVARHEPVTRAQLAVRTGLTKSSVSSIVAELVAARLVVELGTQRGSDLAGQAPPWPWPATAWPGSGWRSTSTTWPPAWSTWPGAPGSSTSRWATTGPATRRP